jgi:TolB-like protein/Flp pilus assembly protein TadD
MSERSSGFRLNRKLLVAGGGIIIAAAIVAYGLLACRTAGRIPEAAPEAAKFEIDSIAVLPFKNLGSYEEETYFEDAFTSLLVSELQKIGSLRVTSIASAMQYRGLDQFLPVVSRELDAVAIVGGSVIRDKESVNLTVWLSHGPTNLQLWSENYDRDMKDLLLLQSEVAQSIADEIGAAITPQEKILLAAARSIDAEVLDHVFQGWYLNRNFSFENFEQAIVHFKKAIDIDPGYAPAYVGLSEAQLFLGQLQQDPELMEQSAAAVQKALELDDTLPTAHAFQGNAKAISWDFAGAEAEYKRTIELNPSVSEARVFYGQILGALDRHDEAIALTEEAHRIDPLNAWITSNVPWAYLYAGRLEEALEKALQVQDLYPDSWTTAWGLGMIYTLLEQYPEAFASLDKSMDLLGEEGSMEVLPYLGYAYGKAGETEKALQVIKRMETVSEKRYVPSYFFAVAYTGLEQKDRALEYLEKAYQEHDFRFVFNIYWADCLCDEPGYIELRKKIGLPVT